MKKVFLTVAFILGAAVPAVFSQQLSRVELSDGSTINGEIVSFADGVYTIKSPATGEVKVAQDKVLRIETASAALTYNRGQSGDLMQAQVAAMREKLMANPENAAVVNAVSKNPTLQEMADDPQIQEAAKKGDIQALMNNPKFMEIVHSPEMQEAVKKIKN